MERRTTDALTNGRDLGGLATADGAVVRSGVVYRSDDTVWGRGAHASALPAHVATAFDLRRPTESALRGQPWFIDDRTVRVPENLAPQDTVASTISNAQELASFYLRLFDAQKRNLGAIMTELARTDALPAVVFCVAGKDRTGVTVAVFGRLLGVSDEALIEDYTKSAVFMEEVRRSGQLGDVERSAVVLPLHDAPAQAMALFLDGLSARHATATDLAQALGLDDAILERLRDRYLTAAG